MDYLPVEFCYAVVAALRDPYDLKRSISSRVWNAAIDKQLKNRVNIEIDIGFQSGSWSYYIVGRRTFKDLQKINAKHLRIAGIQITNCQQVNQASFAEIYKIIQFTVPFMSMSRLALMRLDKIPRGQLQQLLVSYRNSPLYSARIDGFQPDCDYLKGLLECCTLRDIGFHNLVVCECFRDEIEEFALTNSFKHLAYRPKNYKLSWSFFKDLFARPLDESQKECTLEVGVDFHFDELEEFATDLQIGNAKKTIEWKRTDGVVVEVRRTMNGDIWINFSRV